MWLYFTSRSIGGKLLVESEVIKMTEKQLLVKSLIALALGYK